MNTLNLIVTKMTAISTNKAGTLKEGIAYTMNGKENIRFEKRDCVNPGAHEPPKR